MSDWEDYQIEDKITAILRELNVDEPDHWGQGFMTTYQIAAEFAVRHPDEFRELGMRVGGRGQGDHSLMQYFAQQLSLRIRDGRITHIEASWLARNHVKKLVFANEQDQPIEATLLKNSALVMFRWAG